MIKKTWARPIAKLGVEWISKAVSTLIKKKKLDLINYQLPNLKINQLFSELWVV